MKTIRLTLIMLVAIAFYLSIKAGHSFNIVQALPFAEGENINIYHFGSLAVVLITLWGLRRLKKDE
jgi:hypothetical protein